MSTIESADQATEIAVTSLKRYHPILRRPLDAKKDQGKWSTEVDIGISLTRVARVIIDAERARYAVGKLPGMIPREVLEQ